MNHLLVTLLTAACAVSSLPTALCAAEKDALQVTVLTDIPYKSGDELTDYERERCKLDLYLPVGREAFAALVWFHGGGLKTGDKQDSSALAHSLARTGVAVVVANYRLSPNVTYPAYLRDAAATVAWTRAHMAEQGGDPDKLFVGGHSAGGWLTLMVGLDDRYLREFNISLSEIAGLIPVSGQTMTHFTVREERGVGRFTITADEAAPVYYGRKDTPAMLLLYADNDMAARAEENEFFVALMKGAGNERVEGRLVRNRDHGSIAFKIVEDGDPARLAILEFIETQSGAKQSPGLGDAPTR